MAGRVRALDWSSTPLGPLDAWPQSLKTIVGMLLAAPNPMVLLWGAEGVLIYNDGYARFAGQRHPALLGMGAREGWPEIADFNDGNIRRGLAGESWSLRDQELELDRKGQPEPVWMDLDYAPVPDETGRPAGVMCFVTETTDRVQADRLTRQTNERLQLALSAGRGVGTWDWDIVTDRVVADQRFAELYGVDPMLARRGAPLSEFFKAMHPDDAVRVGEEIQRTLKTRSPFRSEYRLVQADGEVRWVAAEGRIIADENGKAVRFPGVTFDITDRRARDAAMAETESRYDALFNSTTTGFCIVQMKFDEDMRPVDYMIVEGNPAYEELTGLHGSTGKWVSDIAPGLEQHWFDLYGGVALTGQPVRFENPADIFGRWYDVEALRIGDPDRHQVAILFTNITDRKQQEVRQAALLRLNDALRDLTDPEEIAATSSAILADALDVTRAGYGVMDMDAETITIARDFNAPGMTSIAGTLRFRDFGSYIDDLARGETVLVTDTRTDPRTAATADALAGIGVSSFINMPLKEQGRVVAMVFVNNVATRHWTEGDSDLLREFAARVRIAIERARATAELEESETRYRTLFNEMDEGFCVIEFIDGPHGPDSDYIHIDANPAYAANAGIENVVGQKLRDMVGDEADAWVERYGAVLRTGKPIRFEQELVATGRWLELSAFRVEPPERKQVAVLFQDLTARKAAELELQSLNATLEERVVERTEELTRAHEALRQSQKMEAVGQLTGGIAHDFNNLLAGISGSLELLGKRLSEGRLNGMERYIDAAQGSAQRAASLTQRLLAFSRRQTLDPRPTDVNRLINGMDDLIRRSIGPDVELEVVGAGGLWATKIDQSQLENALLNLCINGRDAMAPAGGRLTIETSNKWLDDRSARARDLPPGQYVSLCVTDTGTGMPPEVQAQAFDPFFTTKPLGQGTGLGLSMIHGFVRQSGGQVRIYSEIGKGTTMCLYLPRYQGDVDGDEDVGITPVAEGGHGETVLIIDDEETVRMLVAEVLGDAGYNVIEAPDGPSGLEILRSDRRIDLLISDVGLPGGMNGRQVADAARVSRPDLKVLFITGYAENAAVGNGLLAPGMEVLTKPFVMGDLAAKVHDMIEA
ncbi:PAS domain S-box protein [Brevundimonas staleyi]|uniref:histidine kinase n=1 Tax=Brevundimonas staleyi TaxID=74326 RepID=A0ABW0FLQ2_9CAUL